jgi:hypothetical protein
MKRPIAMRCTQEQFDSIKDRINISIISISNFDWWPYLAFFKDNVVTNSKIEYLHTAGIEEIHETFNADIFLEACGVEVDKVWKASEMQYSSGCEWFDFIGDFKIRIKPQFNSANYSQEIEALQAKAKENGMKVTINFEKL